MMKWISGAALVAATFASPVSAQEARTVRVSHADLRLEREADAARLDRRIAHAARAACGRASDWDLSGGNASRRCRAEKRATAAAQRDRLVTEARRVAAR